MEAPLACPLNLPSALYILTAFLCLPSLSSLSDCEEDMFLRTLPHWGHMLGFQIPLLFTSLNMYNNAETGCRSGPSTVISYFPSDSAIFTTTENPISYFFHVWNFFLSGIWSIIPLVKHRCGQVDGSISSQLKMAWKRKTPTMTVKRSNVVVSHVVVCRIDAAQHKILEWMSWRRCGVIQN